MRISIDVHPGSDRTAVAMLVATICLVFAAAAQAIAAFRQAKAANRQAKAADRQVQAAERAIEVSRQQIRAAKELEDKRTMPLLKVTIGSYSTESAMPLVVMNQGAGPALRITCGRHDPGTLNLVPSTLIPLSELGLDVKDSLVVTVSKGMITSAPLYIHCFSTQGTEIVYEAFLKPDDKLSVLRVIEIPNY